MTRFILFLFFCNIAIVHSQTTITVCDIETKMPIPDVILKGLNKDILIGTTGEKGDICINNNIHNDEIISFQMIGYETKTVSYQTLQSKPVVELQVLPVELEAVFIDCIDANLLLEIAFNNTRNRLYTRDTLFYKGEIVQLDKNTNDRQELLVIYSSFINKEKNGKTKTKQQLLDLNHRIETKKTINSELSKNKKWSIDFSIDYTSYKFSEKFRIALSSSLNDSLFIVNYHKEEEGDHEYTFYINKSDTTLNSYSIYISENRGKMHRTGFYNIAKQISNIKFDRTINGCFFL